MMTPPHHHHHRDPSGGHHGDAPLGSGTYGCVTDLVKRCGDSSSRRRKSKKHRYVSKIMVDDGRGSVLFEIRVGEMIVAKHPHDYDKYFAPVEEACPVDLVELRERVDLGACSSHAIEEELLKSKPSFMLLNERFVGKTDFAEFAAAKRSHQPFSRTRFLETMMWCHNHLLEAANRLVDMHVMHVDLSANNVLMNEHGRPVIIDFGLAFQHDPVGGGELPNPSTVFFVYHTAYPPWCIEIVLINYLIHHTVLRPKKLLLGGGRPRGAPPAPKLSLSDAAIIEELRIQQLNEALLKKLCKVVDEYLASNRLFSTDDNFLQCFGEDLAGMKKGFREKWKAFLSLAIGLPLHDVYTRLLAECPSWDNYGLASLFLQTTATRAGGDVHRGQHVAYRRMMLDLVFYCPLDRAAAAKWPDAAATRRPGVAQTRLDMQKIAQP